MASNEERAIDKKKKRTKRTGNIIDNYSNTGIANIAGNQTAESPTSIKHIGMDVLLTSSIPKLKTNSTGIQVHSLGEEIDTNSSLFDKLKKRITKPDKKDRRYRT